jgi:hypothetical protein
MIATTEWCATTTNKLVKVISFIYGSDCLIGCLDA